MKGLIEAFMYGAECAAVITGGLTVFALFGSAVFGVITFVQWVMA